MKNNEDLEVVLSKAFTKSLIRLSTIAFIVIVCCWAFLPFLPILLWALVLAIALYPVRLFIEKKTKWTPARSSTVIALIGVLLLGVPTALVGNAFASNVLLAFDAYEAGTLVVPVPENSVKDWPVIGTNLYETWKEAATDFPGFVEQRQPQIKGVLNWFVETASGAAKSVFLLIGAIIIAGIMLAWAQPATTSIKKIFISFSDEQRGGELHALTTATIRQVAIGIIGIAFLTAIVFGLTVNFASVPAAPLLTIVALVFAICQIPVTLVAIVASVLLWSGNDTSALHNTIFTILMIAASLTDNFLKPLVLGRGLAVPMPVVLIGAIGGMMSGGILGMFIGAAFLAAGYQVFMAWVATENGRATHPALEQKSLSSER
ncbi:AI-2E family transporter [Vibrio alfacsensis]|uniref:AI-2E family transporter n=1 Tax=Vibrio alfacsensis TaxID=1074311 RepID=UPI001BEF586A|nr:AI-2E family transporter [Vibrio alfacsensis]BCN27363.1 AI-2E family transporter [Vibrio alfacsensis]